MKLSFKKTLCLLLTVCVLCSTLSLPVFASETVSTDFNSLDQEKLQVAIDSLQEPYTEGTALVKTSIPTHSAIISTLKIPLKRFLTRSLLLVLQLTKKQRMQHQKVLLLLS